MTLMTETPANAYHAPVQRIAVSYRTLTPLQQNAWHNLLDEAQTAREDGDFAWLHRAHQRAASLLGIQLQPKSELVECACHCCPDDCDAITDSDLCGHTDDGLPQCAACLDDHDQRTDC